MNDPSLEDFQAQSNSRVKAALDKWLPPQSTQPKQLHAAMRYATLSNGKYVRPMLVYATGRALGADLALLDAPASAIELIHAFSLVHDDLPAMDDDDLRRGNPTCHIAYDEATAILAGDALQSLAFSILASHNSADISAEHRLIMVEILARASGSRGMAGGQIIDILAVGQEMTLPELENMHIHKTGALIRSCVQLAALAIGTSKAEKESLDHFAKNIGLAYQVQDDILDIVASTETLGKTSGKDQADNKPTYPALLGMTGAKMKALELQEEALNALQHFDNKADILRKIALYVVNRGY